MLSGPSSVPQGPSIVRFALSLPASLHLYKFDTSNRCYILTRVLGGRNFHLRTTLWYDEQDGHADVGQHREHHVTSSTVALLA